VSLLRNPGILVLAALIGAVGLAVYVIAPALDGGERGDEPTLGAPARDRPATSPGEPPAPSEGPTPAPAPPPLAQPTNAAEVIATFPDALRAVRARLGRDAQMTRVIVNEISVLFGYRVGRGERTATLRWRPERESLETAPAGFARTPRVSEDVFPLRSVSATAPGRMLVRLRRLAPPGHVVHTVHLFRLPVTERLIWQLTVEADGRYLTYRARPDGGGLSQLR
jgi:hypothetical protein